MSAESLRSFDDILELCRDHSSCKVGDVMTTTLQTISPDMTLVRARGSMLAQRHRRLPVLQDGEAVGILTQRDLLKQVFIYA